jgi:protein TonB
VSYAERREIGTNRSVAIIMVAIVHVFLGYVIVTGLTYSRVRQAIDELKIIDVAEEPPPPPEEPPPAPAKQPPETPPPVVAPPPIVRIKAAQPPIVQSVQVAPPPVVTYRAAPAPPAPPAPPPPPPPLPQVKSIPPVSATGDLQSLFSEDDYPQSAIQAEEQGAVTVRLTVGINGRVANCDVVSPSGSRTLDRATCKVLQNRARFTPARDNRGSPTTDTVTKRIRWVLEG